METIATLRVDQKAGLSETSERETSSQQRANTQGSLVSKVDGSGDLIPGSKVDYTYDGAAPNALGRLVRVENSSGSIDYQYDPMVQVSKIIRDFYKLSGFPKSLEETLEYDDVDRLKKFTLPDHDLIGAAS